MSSVRMCDRCGRIFSENEEDWSTFTGAVKRRDKVTGRAFTENAEQDACPECTPGGTLAKPSLRPQIAAAPKSEAPSDMDTKIASLEREEILERTAAVERELADLKRASASQP